MPRGILKGLVRRRALDQNYGQEGDTEESQSLLANWRWSKQRERGRDEALFYETTVTVRGGVFRTEMGGEESQL